MGDQEIERIAFSRRRAAVRRFTKIALEPDEEMDIPSTLAVVRKVKRNIIKAKNQNNLLLLSSDSFGEEDDPSTLQDYSMKNIQYEGTDILPIKAINMAWCQSNPFLFQETQQKGKMTIQKINFSNSKPESSEYIDEIKEMRELVVSINQCYREIPMHVIQQRFNLKQTSLLKQCNESDIDFGNRYDSDLKQLRVYLFNRSDIFLDYELNVAVTTIGSLIKSILSSFHYLKKQDQLVIYPDQPYRYKIFPSEGEGINEVFLADTNIPELSDNMSILEAIGDDVETCCFIEVEGSFNGSERTSNFSSSRIEVHTLEDQEQCLREFQNVYNKQDQIVFKVICKDKEFSSIIRIGKTECIQDIFDLIQRKKRVDIDRRNFFIQGKINNDYGEDLVELDFRLPVFVLSCHILKITRRQFEDRLDGAHEEKSNENQDYQQVQQAEEDQEDKDADREDDEQNNEENDDEDSESENEYKSKSRDSSASSTNMQSRMKKSHRQGRDKHFRLRSGKLVVDSTLKYVQLMRSYEEFEVTKISYMNNQINKQSKRIIGIDEHYIYNKKIQPKFISLSSILGFLFPSPSNESKCPKKKIDDIKDMYVIQDTTLLIQFQEKDYLKSWLLSNSDPCISKRMFQKLSFLRTTQELLIP